MGARSRTIQPYQKRAQIYTHLIQPLADTIVGRRPRILEAGETLFLTKVQVLYRDLGGIYTSGNEKDSAATQTSQATIAQKAEHDLLLMAALEVLFQAVQLIRDADSKNVSFDITDIGDEKTRIPRICALVGDIVAKRKREASLDISDELYDLIGLQKQLQEPDMITPVIAKPSMSNLSKAITVLLTVVCVLSFIALMVLDHQYGIFTSLDFDFSGQTAPGKELMEYGALGGAAVGSALLTRNWQQGQQKGTLYVPAEQTAEAKLELAIGDFYSRASPGVA